MLKQLVSFASLGGAVGLLLMVMHGTAAAVWVEAVPEIDPGTAASGIAILTGAAMLLIERFRRR